MSAASPSRLRYFVAASIDGFIATPDGGVDWLTPFQRPAPEDRDDDAGWEALSRAVGGAICGRATYETMAGFGFWKGTKQPAMVVTSRPVDAGNPLVMSDADPVRGLERLKTRVQTGDLWLIGGGKLASALVQHIDSLELHIVPLVLGAGVPLFAGPSPMQAFEAVNVRRMGNGLVRTYYARKT